jgi:hypothetical protein
MTERPSSPTHHWCAIYLYFKGPFRFQTIKFDQFAQFTISHFNGRKVKRLDKAITEILKFVRDKLFDRLITTNKGKLCSKLKELRVRHRTSEKLDINQITKN